MAVKITVYNKQKDLAISSHAVKNIVRAILALEKQACDEVAIHFVTTKAISLLHEEYFNDPSTTDCISFPMDEESEMGYRVLGEVFVCPETAINYAQRHKSDAHDECMLYIVHGLLHLMGYDDLEPCLKASMRRAEKKHMVQLKKLNLRLTR
jgi:probable rRNA maturation factor